MRNRGCPRKSELCGQVCFRDLEKRKVTLAEAFGRWLWRAGIGPGDWRLLCCELGRAGQAQAAAGTEAGGGGACGCGGDVPGLPGRQPWLWGLGLF